MIRRGRRGEKEGAIISKQVLSRREKSRNLDESFILYPAPCFRATSTTDSCENPWKEKTETRTKREANIRSSFNPPMLDAIHLCCCRRRRRARFLFLLQPVFCPVLVVPKRSAVHRRFRVICERSYNQPMQPPACRVKPRCSLLPLLREPKPVDAVGDSATWEIPGNARKAAPLSFLPPPFASSSLPPPPSSTVIYLALSPVSPPRLPVLFSQILPSLSVSTSPSSHAVSFSFRCKEMVGRREGRAERRSIRENWPGFRLCRPL